MNQLTNTERIIASILVIIFCIVFATVVILKITYNFNTGFWGDTSYVDPNYFDWHPSIDDSCQQLQDKLDLFHPHGTNPVRFEILKAMWENNCTITIGGVKLP